jgi:hypothetical protein
VTNFNAANCARVYYVPRFPSPPWAPLTIKVSQRARLGRASKTSTILGLTCASKNDQARRSSAAGTYLPRLIYCVGYRGGSKPSTNRAKPSVASSRCGNTA